MHYENRVLRQKLPKERVWKAPRPCTKTIPSMLVPCRASSFLQFADPLVLSTVLTG